MGASNVIAAYNRYAGKVPATSMQLLAYMAAVSKDEDAVPWFGQGHAALAEFALGRSTPIERADIKAVERAIAPLAAVGAIKTDRRGSLRRDGNHTVRYRLHIKGTHVPRNPGGQDIDAPPVDETSRPPESGTDVPRKPSPRPPESGGQRRKRRKRSEKTRKKTQALVRPSPLCAHARPHKIHIFPRFKWSTATPTQSPNRPAHSSPPPYPTSRPSAPSAATASASPATPSAAATSSPPTPKPAPSATTTSGAPHDPAPPRPVARLHPRLRPRLDTTPPRPQAHPMTRHLTAGEKRAQASGQAAVARALAHTRPPEPEPNDEHLRRLYPYVTTHRAREIRLEIEADRTAATWWPTPAQETP